MCKSVAENSNCTGSRLYSAASIISAAGGSAMFFPPATGSSTSPYGRCSRIGMRTRRRPTSRCCDQRSARRPCASAFPLVTNSPRLSNTTATHPGIRKTARVTDHYKSVLQELTDTAYAAGIRVQFCLLWNIKNEISHNPDDFVPGGTMDRFYENQVRSIGLALRDHPGAMAYSIGNEALVIWQVNALHRSSYEGRAAAFIARRLHDLREVAPRQLLATDEINDYDKSSWLARGDAEGQAVWLRIRRAIADLQALPSGSAH